jgi:hypothetical protein
MNNRLLLLILLGLAPVSISAQTPAASPAAIENIQPVQSAKTDGDLAGTSAGVQSTSVKIPAGTSIEVEVAYTVSSVDVKPGELLSFRVLIPVTVNGVVAIDEGALVTARVTTAKRGGHWGKAGRLSWTMQDVIAIDNSRVALSPEASSRPGWILLESKSSKKTDNRNQSTVKGTSHGTEVATRTIVAAAIFPPLAPLALMHGFKRGGNAVLPEGKRFVVAVKNDASVSVKNER